MTTMFTLTQAGSLLHQGELILHIKKILMKRSEKLGTIAAGEGTNTAGRCC